MLPVFKDFHLTCDFKIKAIKDNLEKKNNIHKCFNNIAPKWQKGVIVLGGWVGTFVKSD